MPHAQLIRRAEKTDLRHLHAIERAASTLFPPGRIPDVDDVMPMEHLERAVDAGALLVATVHGSVVGFAMAEELAGNFHLSVMAVHPDHAKRGLGRLLVSAMIQEASQRRHSAVTLTTFDDLPWNGPFYRSAGFRVLSEEELSPTLRCILEEEGRLGMAHRVAMRHELGAQPDGAV